MIPKIVHRIWVGSPMPDHLAAYGETWKAHHSDWEHVLWTEANMPPLRNQALYDAAETIAPNNVGQFRSDIARYEILHQHGGVYCDADFECLRPLDPLLDGVEAFAGWEVDHVWVGNAILGATIGHPFMEALIRRLPANVQRYRGARPNKMTGPRFLTPLARRRPDLTVFPSSMLYPYCWDELERGGEDFPGAYAIHHWQNQRNVRDRPLAVR